MDRVKVLPRKISKAELIFSLLFAIMCILDRNVTYTHETPVTLANAYITTIGIIDVILVPVITLIMYVAICVVKLLISKIAPFCVLDKERNVKWFVFLISFVAIMICWIPYMMSYWPGGIYNDTLYSIHIALHKQPMDNQNTVLYALIWRFFFWVGGILKQGDYGGLKLFTVTSMVTLAATLSYFVFWLYKKGIRTWLLVCFNILFMFAPVFPFYGISLWKDTPFGIVVFLYTMLLYDMSRSSDELKITTRSMVMFLVFSVLIVFLRNNGIYIIIITSICLLMAIRKKSADFKRILIATLALIVGIIIVKGPVYSALKIEKSATVESMGIPLQQVAYIVATEGNISVEDEEVIESIMSVDDWRYLYNPIVVDTIKFAPSFDGEYFNTHVSDFLKMYIHVCLRNPVKAVKGYLLSTLGFWDVWQSSSSAYICKDHTAQSEYFMSDYVEYYFDFSWDDIVSPRHYISSGLVAFIMLWALFLALGTKGNVRKIVPIIPGLALWGTLMVATPLAFSFRYIFPVFLCIPIYIMCVCKEFLEDKGE